MVMQSAVAPMANDLQRRGCFGGATIIFGDESVPGSIPEESRAVEPTRAGRRSGAVVELSTGALAREAWKRTLLAVLAFSCIGPQVAARTIEIGPNHRIHMPSEAAAIAAPGDRIEIEPGEYTDCAVWTADRLTIVGGGTGAVIRDKSCQGKGLFVVSGDGIIVRNITFVGAHVPDGNGAGIRVEGRDLSVEHSRFIDNENGILAGSSPQSTIKVADSEFLGNGKCTEFCAHGIYVGHVALLRIERSRFLDTRVGHHVKSRALRTELVGNTIADGEAGTSSYLVDLPNGGSLVMMGNSLEKGASSSNRETAVSIGSEGVTQPSSELRIERNRFINRQAEETVFCRNLTGEPARLVGNQFGGRVVPLVGPGTVE